MSNDLIRAHILNVDDDPAGLYAKSRVLRFLGYDVIEANTGANALKAVVDSCPDLVLLDVNLPDISGYEVCRQIKSNSGTARIPVLMTSAVFTRSSDRARGIEGGADGYLLAPIEPDIVNATIQSLLRIRKVELELHEAATQWKTTFRSITDGIALLDAEGSVLRCNKAFEGLLESAESNLAGRPIDDILAALVERSPMTVGSLLASPSSITVETSFRHREDRSSRDLSITFDPVFERGVRTGSVCILSDITRERTIQRELLEAKLLAEQANQAKDRFLATLSHELRTPLTPIVLLLEELRSDVMLSPELQPIIEMMYRNISLEARLIDDLLDLSRITKGKLSLNLAEVQLSELIRLTSEIIQGDLDAKEITLVCKLEATTDRVRGDAGRIQQILWNLLKNAIKFTGMDGIVQIRTYNPIPALVSIEVCDNGIGLEAESIERIFNAFEQADHTTSQQFGGLGLGLAISKNLAKMHNGDLVAESKGVGHGATFTLTLPVANEP